MTGEAFHLFNNEQSVLRVGILGFRFIESGPVIATLRSAGWSFSFITEDDRPWSGWTRFDLLIFGPDVIDSDFLQLVSQTWRETNMPILVIARDHDPRMVADVLRSGASDYVPAPFAPEELEARIRVLAMRFRDIEARKPAGRLSLDHVTRTVHAGSMHVSLSPREWEVLNILLDSESSLVTVEQLSESLTGEPGNETIVISTISRLRKKLQANRFVPLSIQTVYGQGYVARWRYFAESGERNGDHS